MSIIQWLPQAGRIVVSIFLLVSSSVVLANPLQYPTHGCDKSLGPGLIADRPLDLTGDLIYEGGQVRPIAFSPPNLSANYPDLAQFQDLVFIINTPANCLEIFEQVTNSGVISLNSVSDIPVGIEPVAVNTRVSSSGVIEVWVVNHISDSISVIEIKPNDISIVAETLDTGDAPRDIVFAGTVTERTFVATAARGFSRYFTMNVLNDGLTHEEDRIGQGDVWVYDAEEKTREGIINLFSAPIRSLEVSPDLKTVYAGVFMSGNKTSVVPVNSFIEPDTAANAYKLTAKQAPSIGSIFTTDELAGIPGAPVDSTGQYVCPLDPTKATGNICAVAPLTSLIVEDVSDSETAPLWRDEVQIRQCGSSTSSTCSNEDWNEEMAFDYRLADNDVFLLDADADMTNANAVNFGEFVSTNRHAVIKQYSGMGTTLFNMTIGGTKDAVRVSYPQGQSGLSHNDPLLIDWLQRFDSQTLSLANPIPSGGYQLTLYENSEPVFVFLNVSETGAMDVPKLQTNEGRYLSVTNIDANNIKSFEPRLKGAFVDNSVSVIDLQDDIYLPSAILPGEPDSPYQNNVSSALPTTIIYAPSIRYWFVAAFGGDQIHYTQDGTNWHSISVGDNDGPSGPTGLAFKNGLLYVYSRFDNAVRIYQFESSAKSLTELTTNTLFSPEKDSIIAGRKLFYDAVATGNGRVSCASCHIYGDMDELAWNLGNPLSSGEMGQVKYPGFPDDISNVSRTNVFPDSILKENVTSFHPVKGPLLTQSLRGLRGQGAMHWRGDKGNLLQSYLRFFADNDPANPIFTGTFNADFDIVLRKNGVGITTPAEQLLSVSAFNSSKSEVDVNVLNAYRQRCGNGVITTECNDFWKGRDMLASESAWAEVEKTIEELALSEFNPAFRDLLGGDLLTQQEFSDFSDFVFALRYPPNPNKSVWDMSDESLPNNSVKNKQFVAGKDLYFNVATTRAGVVDGPIVDSENNRCNDCHSADGEGFGSGRSGTNTFVSKFPAHPTDFSLKKMVKVPHMRNLYQRVGLYDFPDALAGEVQDQVKGFGFAHDSSFITLDRFFKFDNIVGKPAFGPLNNSVASGSTSAEQGNRERRNSIVNFILQFDTGMHTLEGRQYTIVPDDFTCPGSPATPMADCDFSALFDVTDSNGADDKNPQVVVDLIPSLLTNAVVKSLLLSAKGIGDLPSDNPDKTAVGVWQQDIETQFLAKIPEKCTAVFQGAIDNVRNNSTPQTLRDFIAVSNDVGELELYVNFSGSYKAYSYSKISGAWDNTIGSYDGADAEWIGVPYRDILLTAMKHPVTYTCYPTST